MGQNYDKPYTNVLTQLYLIKRGSRRGCWDKERKKGKNPKTRLHLNRNETEPLAALVVRTEECNGKENLFQ